MAKLEGQADRPTFTAADTKEDESAEYPMEEYEVATC